MGEFLHLIGQLLSFFASWVPRLVHVDCRYRGVRFVRGKPPKLAMPGLRFYWPLTTDFAVWPIIARTLQLESQSLVSSDGASVELKVRIVYTVPDPVLLLAELYAPENSIADLALGVTSEIVGGMTVDEITRDIRGTNRQLLQAIRRPMQRVGIRVQLAQIASFTRVLALKHFQETVAREDDGEA